MIFLLTRLVAIAARRAAYAGAFAGREREAITFYHRACRATPIWAITCAMALEAAALNAVRIFA